MVNQKHHRWTVEEENALLAGVDKYGTGKWMKILSDEDFAPFLIARSNVDLKDKWRNLCGSASSRAASPRCLTDNETDPWYNTTILGALPSPDNSYGLDMETIYSHTENVVDEAVQEVKVKEEEVDIVDEVFVQDYSQVLREVGYEEHEIYVALEHVEELDESPMEGHVESAMSMNIEDHPDACLINDTQESTMKPKFLLKLVFKALKKLMLALKTSVQKMMLKILYKKL